MTRVLVTRRLLDEAADALRGRGFDLDVADGPTRADLLRAVRAYDGIVSMISDRFDADVFAAARGGPLRIVANYGVGHDNVDLAAARSAGIWATNTPDVLTEATAEMAWTLLLSAARRVVEGDALARSGGWEGWRPDQLVGRAISGKTVGVVGAGRIGRAFLRMAAGFRPRLLYFARATKPDLERETGAAFRDLDGLLAESDVVSVHLPGGDATRGLLSAARLARMKPSAILVNTGRGSVVDEAALAAALRAGRLGAAGLDVYEGEPKIHPDLRGLPNVVLAPHLGSATREARVAMARVCAENVEAALRGEPPRNRLEPPR